VQGARGLRGGRESSSTKAILLGGRSYKEKGRRKRKETKPIGFLRLQAFRGTLVGETGKADKRKEGVELFLFSLFSLLTRENRK